MAMTIDQWQDTDRYVNVQDKSVLVDGLDDLGKKALIYSGLIPSGNPIYRCARPLNKEIRIPAYFTSSSVYYHNNVITNSGFTNDERSVNGFYGHVFNDGNIYNKSIILAYVPRLYVQLQPLREFIADIGLTNHFHEYPIFNMPTASYTYGYKFDRLLNIPENAYVLKSYGIYRNKKDGNIQTALYTYDYSPKTTVMPILYDTFVPCSILGSYSGSAYVPYMRSLLPKYYVTSSKATSRFRYTAPLYVGINGAINGNKISGAINMVSVTGSEDFVENPFMNTTIANYYPDYWSTLTTAPTGEGIYYIAADLKTWKQLFNASGMPWSDDIDVVMSPDGSGLHRPTTPGQPENPVDDGDGDGDNISDIIDYPSVSYMPTAARYMYALTDSKVKDTSNYLFSQTFLDDVRRLWTNPGDYIVDLSYYPVDFAESRLYFEPAIDGSPVYIGNLNSGVTGKEIIGGSTAIYGGFVDITNYYNSYLDYSPNTSLSVYIPYIGVRPLDIDMVTGHRVHLIYYLDLGTGQFIAALGLDGDITQDELGRFSGSIGQPLAQYCGNMAIHIPLNGTSQNAYMLNSAVQATQILTSAGALAGGVATGNIAGVVGGAGGIISAVKSPIIKEEIQGTLTPATGLYSPQTAYLIVNRPKTAEPSTFKDKQGYTSCYAGTVSNFTGFLQCAAVEIPATGTMTEQEQQEIINLLTGGIYCG